MKDIACEEHRNLSTNTFCIIRLDTKEIVETRALTAQERQTLLAQERRSELDATTKEKTTQPQAGGADGVHDSAPSLGATRPH